MHTSRQSTPLHSIYVWDRHVRLFHWINVICILGLISIGLIIYFDKDFGISSDGKILLKTIHVYFGYVFVINLLWRLIMLFIGGPFSRWKSITFCRRGFVSELGSYIRGLSNRNAPQYAGHNPLSKLMINLLFILITIQAVTGLVLAGTDLYYPPFGNQFVEWIKAPTTPGVDHVEIKPGSKLGIDETAYKEMRDFRKPFITMHKYVFYTLVVAIVLHIAGVVVTEIRERNGLVSAMINGSKVFSSRPVDLPDEKQD